MKDNNSNSFINMSFFEIITFFGNLPLDTYCALLEFHWHNSCMYNLCTYVQISDFISSSYFDLWYKQFLHGNLVNPHLGPGCGPHGLFEHPYRPHGLWNGRIAEWDCVRRQYIEIDGRMTIKMNTSYSAWGTGSHLHVRRF